MRVPRPRHALIPALCLAGLLVAGSAGALSAPGSSTDVSFVPITEHHVLTNTYLAAGRASSPVVIGASTTVPTDATTVQFSVNVKGTGSGNLSFYPAGNAARSDGFVWAKGGGQGVVASNVGTANEVTFVNRSSSAINLSVSITGYSTDVTAGDINGSGGTAGEVLTDTVTGAAVWRTPGTVYVDHVLNTTLPSYIVSPYTADLRVPAGSYLMQAVGTVEAGSVQMPATTVFCELLSEGTVASVSRTSLSSGQADTAVALDAVVTLDADGLIGLKCSSTAYTDLVQYTLTAVPVGTVDDQSR